VIIAGDADGSRTLFGMAKDRMTLRQFERINRFGVPSTALMASLVFNLFLVLFVSNPLSIIAASNLGYVIAHFFAITGFLLLRRDRPDWVRPMRLGAIWIPIAWITAIVLLGAVVFGATGFSVTGYGGVLELLVGIGLLVLSWVFFLIRRLGQDKTRIQWREKAEPIHTELREALLRHTPDLREVGPRQVVRGDPHVQPLTAGAPVPPKAPIQAQLEQQPPAL
jgi:amino acid transporter